MPHPATIASVPVLTTVDDFAREITFTLLLKDKGVGNYKKKKIALIVSRKKIL